jgi:hypothetical protein
MKKLPEALVTLGVLSLMVSLVGRFFGPLTRVMGIRLISFLLFANTLFLLAISVKLIEKK